MNTDKQNDDQGQIEINKNQTYSLILHNDDYHTFQYVIDALVQICEMDIIQATQCTYLVHSKDKCEVKHGSKLLLLPMQIELRKRDLKAVIK
jgi:ATP-dependent Clp protease adaptor protein ClpS